MSDSQLTIKGPAAGLIVIVARAVFNLGAEFVPEPSADERAVLVAGGQTDAQIGRQLEDRLTLGIGVVSGVIQVLLGLVRVGRLVDFFPLTPVYGMLASIGVIIIAKQLYTVAGVDPPLAPAGHDPPGPLQLLAEFPARVTHFNGEILVIGLVSLGVLFGHHFSTHRWVKMVPAQLIVLASTVALGFAFDLDHRHKHLLPAYLLNGDLADGEVEVNWPKFLVGMPNVLAEPAAAFGLPDFRAVATAGGLRWLSLFVLIGSLESLLAAKAVEQLDP